MARWIGFPDPELPVFGLPWFSETTPRLQRLPDRLRERVREPVWNLAQSPAGGRLRFRTDSSGVEVRLRYERIGHMHNMHRIGQMGLDLYADGAYWKSVYPTEAGEAEGAWFTGAPRGTLRHIDLYLPLYHPVELLAVGVADDAAIAPPFPFAVERPVVYYGSSITQGGCASRPGMSYQAILSRQLNLDHVNLGFSGNGKGEPEMAAAVAELDGAAFVLDFAQNCDSVAAMAAAYQPFIDTVRTRHPRTPIICITPIFTTSELWSDASRERLAGMRQVVRDAVATARKRGDAAMSLVEGPALLGPGNQDGLVDGVHPNDLGFQQMAVRLASTVAQVLGLGPT
jgi:lysophospholipase L1-like esterase